MPHRIISDVYLLKKTWSVFGKREIIANAVKNMSLHRLYDAGLHKQNVYRIIILVTYRILCALSNRLWQYEIMLKISKASCSPISHSTLGSCAVGFLNIAHNPFSKLQKPVCSFLSDAVW